MQSDKPESGSCIEPEAPFTLDSRKDPNFAPLRHDPSVIRGYWQPVSVAPTQVGLSSQGCEAKRCCMTNALVHPLQSTLVGQWYLLYCILYFNIYYTILTILLQFLRLVTLMLHAKCSPFSNVIIYQTPANAAGLCWA